eukprot:Plantae.Rhodophyta-Hildenbrandia_rubra.ctg17060.p1 GENE.Plantae.Rhodophyta-Hildenbrandia_rubra.ctg17060~~Plantae.Rhodophyta-Hildenbrandia_rubra.ctg17060.p1  ORF type:complete len:467 (+),score=43.02 Plantae.Rhodophyta-Hildenbrandia_rubra.ctg17060:547-1947(+)
MVNRRDILIGSFVLILVTLLGQISGLTTNQILRTSRSSYGFEIVDSFSRVPENNDDPSCPFSRINITRTIQGINSNETRIPHSLISIDGDSCGPLNKNTTDQELAAEDYVQIVKGKFLTSLKSQADANSHVFISSMYRAIHREDNDYVSRVLRTLDQRNDSEIFVGYERWSAWKCGENRTIRVPRYTFLLFVRSSNTAMDLGKIINGSYTVQAARQFLFTFGPGSTQPCAYVGAPPQETDSDGSQGSGSSQQSGGFFPTKVFQCFPAMAKVLSSDRGEVRIKDLDVGDEVIAPRWKDALQVSPSKVLFFTHQLQRGMFEFVQLRSESNKTIDLSPGHYIHTSSGLKAAKDVEIGDTLFRYSEGRFADELVASIFRVQKEGLYNLKTGQGNLIVDGFAVSCYTTVLKPIVAHPLVAGIEYIASTMHHSYVAINRLLHSQALLPGTQRAMKKAFNSVKVDAPVPRQLT